MHMWPLQLHIDPDSPVHTGSKIKESPLKGKNGAHIHSSSTTRGSWEDGKYLPEVHAYVYGMAFLQKGMKHAGLYVNVQVAGPRGPSLQNTHTYTHRYVFVVRYYILEDIVGHCLQVDAADRLDVTVFRWHCWHSAQRTRNSIWLPNEIFGRNVGGWWGDRSKALWIPDAPIPHEETENVKGNGSKSVIWLINRNWTEWRCWYNNKQNINRVKCN